MDQHRLPGAQPFRFLNDEEYGALSLEERLAYLPGAIRALLRQAGGKAGEEPGSAGN